MPVRRKNPAQPLLKFLLVRGADLHRGMAGHVGEFGRCPQEAAALPFRMSRRACQVTEDRLDLRRQASLRLREPLPEQREIGLVAAGEIGRDQIVLALEMIIQRPLGDTGLRRHRIDADAADAVIVEQRVRRRDDALACRDAGSCHGADVYRPVNIHNATRTLG